MNTPKAERLATEEILTLGNLCTSYRAVIADAHMHVLGSTTHLRHRLEQLEHDYAILESNFTQRFRT